MNFEDMNQNVYHTNKLYYKRRPTAKPERFPGVKSAVAVVTGNEGAEEGGTEINKVLYIRRDDGDFDQQDSMSSPRDLIIKSDKTASPQLNLSLPNHGYEQLRDSKVYKRTRHLHQSPREPSQWPVGLELAGKRIIENTDGSSTMKENELPERHNTPTYARESLRRLLENIPKLSRAGSRASGSPNRPHKVCLSPSFYSDFGLRSDRTDTFSGLRRVKKLGPSTDEEFARLIKEKAKRHILACQSHSSTIRRSKAARSVNSLKATLGPSRSTTSIELPTQYVRSMTRSLERNTSFVDVARKPYALFIKTRDNTAYSLKRQQTDPLPEISGRTLVLGYEDRVVL